MVGNEGSFLAPKKLKLPNFGKNANWHQLYFQGFAIRGALVLHLAISGLALGTAGVGSPIWTGAHSHLWSPFNILMPNHLHLFAWPGILNADLDGWVRYWKSQFSNTIGNRSLRWQSSCFHHRLRSCESADSKRLYMINNPVRAGLVARSEEWPFQGELFKSESWW